MLWKYFLMLQLIVLISVYHSDVMKIPPYATIDHSDQCIPQWCYENTSLCYIWSFWSVYTRVMLWKYFLMLHLIILISVYHSNVMKILPYATFDHSDQCIPQWCYENTSLCYTWSFWSVYTRVMLWKYLLMLHFIVQISVYHSDVMKIPPLCYIWSFWSVYTRVMLWK